MADKTKKNQVEVSAKQTIDPPDIFDEADEVLGIMGDDKQIRASQDYDKLNLDELDQAIDRLSPGRIDDNQKDVDDQKTYEGINLNIAPVTRVPKSQLKDNAEIFDIDGEIQSQDTYRSAEKQKLIEKQTIKTKKTGETGFELNSIARSDVNPLTPPQLTNGVLSAPNTSDPEGDNYLLDFGCHEVNNYWRMDKLEEQEQELQNDDGLDDLQKEMDKESIDSEEMEQQAELEQIMMDVQDDSLRYEINNVYGDVQKGIVNEMKISKDGPDPTREGVKKRGRRLTEQQVKDKNKKKREQELEQIDRDFEDSQNEFKKYMKTRQQFNSNQIQQDAKLKRFELTKDQKTAIQNKSFAQLLEKEQAKEEDGSKAEEEEGDDDQKEQDDDEEEKGEGSNLPSIDFERLLRNTKRQKTQELPFTNTQVEDVIFINQITNVITENPREIEIIQEVISLQCNFYMKDCYYYNMIENERPVNRMGTENYDVSDWDNLNKKLPFDQQPNKNLVIDQKQSYVHKVQQNELMPTENREGYCEYVLTKWLVNKKGGMKMIMQSSPFKMDGTFKEHDEDIMELQLNEDGKYVFLIQNDKENILELKIKVWDVKTLSEDEKCVEPYETKLRELKEKKLNKLDLICDNHYLSVVYYDKDHEGSYLEKYQIISEDMLKNKGSKRDDVFTFNPFFESLPETKQYIGDTLPIYNIGDTLPINFSPEERMEFIFPLKIFLDSSHTGKKGQERTPENIRFKVLFIYHKLFKYFDISGNVLLGYPMTFESVSMKQLDQWTTEQFENPDLDKLYIMEMITKEAAKKFKKYNFHTFDSKTIILGKDHTKLEANKKLEGKFFMLPSEWLNFDDEADWSKNPLMSTDIQVTRDFKQIGFNNRDLKEFLVYVEEYSTQQKLLCFMNNIKLDSKKQGSLNFINNQKNKNQIRCIRKGLGIATTLYCFFPEDLDNNRKIFKIKNDYESASLDCQALFMDPEVRKSNNDISMYTMGILTIKQFTQNIMYILCRPEERIYEMKQINIRYSVGQVFNAQYPCLAANLGLEKLCIHINLNKLNPRALIYDFNEVGKKHTHQHGHSDQEEGAVEDHENDEVFVGFVNYNNFSDVGLDERFVSINICSRFAYLTRIPSKDKKSKDGKEKVYLNLLIIDAYNPIPQAVHFRSQKVFDFSTRDEFEDVIKENLIFKVDDDIHLMTQFPKAIHHSILSTDINDEEDDDDNISDRASALGLNTTDINNVNIDELDDKLEAGSYNNTDAQSNNELMVAAQKLKNRHDKKQLKMKRENIELMKKDLQKKLKGNMIPVTLFQSFESSNFSVYFAVKSEEFDNFIEIKRFDPTEDRKNNVKRICTLRKKNLLVFEQLKDGSFIIIDNMGVVEIYNFNDTGQHLDRQERLYLHDEDIDRVKTFGQFERVLIDREVMIAQRRVFYFHDTRDDIVPGVLQSESLVSNIDSDYNFDCVDGPIRYKGQDQYILMFVYKDSKDEQVFFFRQRIYTLPNSAKKKLVDDFNRACKASTFLESGDILANFGDRFIKYDKDGFPKDEVFFQGQPTQFLGQTEYTYADRIHLIVYWHQFKSDKDDGLCKQIFIITDKGDIEIPQHIADQEQIDLKKFLKQKFSLFPEYRSAIEFFKSKTKSTTVSDPNEEFEESPTLVKKKEKGIPGILVLVDKNRGLCYLEHSERGSYWHQKCIDKAIFDYQERNELITMSDDTKYFLFYNNFLDIFSLWYLFDQSQYIVKDFLTLQQEQYKKQSKINNFADLAKKLTGAKQEESVKFGQIKKQKSMHVSFKQNEIVQCKTKGKSFEDMDVNTQNNLKKAYPELRFPEYFPQNLEFHKKAKNKYIKKFLTLINLQLNGTKIDTSLEPNNLANHHVKNLLNGNKTKFIALNVPVNYKDQEKVEDDKNKEGQFYIELKFPNGAEQISAFGFQSSNNFPHLDPSEIRIDILEEQHNGPNDSNNNSSSYFGSYKQKQANSSKFQTVSPQVETTPEFEPCLQIPELKFKYRSQIIYFIKPNPWQKIKEVRIYIYKNRFTQVKDEMSGKVGYQAEFQDDNSYKLPLLNFQMSQILILKKKKQFDYKFVKTMDLNFWEQTPKETEGELGEKKWVLEGKDHTNIFEELNESKIRANENVDYIINSTIQKYKQQQNKWIQKETFDQNIHRKIAFLKQDNVTKQIIVEKCKHKHKKDLVVKVIFGHCDHGLQEERMTLFGSIFKFDLGRSEFKDQDKAKSIKPHNFKKIISYTQSELLEQMPEAHRINEKIIKLKQENEQFILLQLALESYQQDLDTIYSNQNRIRNWIYKFSKLITVKFSRENFMLKRSQAVQVGKMEELEHEGFKDKEELEDLKLLSYKLPTEESTILNVFYTSYSRYIQIMAVDTLKNVLIFATWDIKEDYEKSMLQLNYQSRDPEMANLLIVRSIGCLEDKKIKQTPEKEIMVRKGAYNYLLNGDTFLDLENNIPFLYSDVNSAYEDEDNTLSKSSVSNVKKIYKDSSRFLSTYENHHLVFCYTMKDVQIWVDVLKQQNRKMAIKTSMNILKAFRIQYSGMSLFHHFADDQQIIKLVHKEYMQALEQQTFESDSEKNMPLFILCPDDKHHFVALNLAMKAQKPTNFEFMVSILKEFHDICSSKMMLGNFTEMMSLGFGQILDYFDKSQFNPPMLSTPFTIEWPEDLEEFPFASNTSLISEEILRDKVKGKQSKYDGMFSCFKFEMIGKFLSSIVNICLSADKTHKYTLHLNDGGSQSNLRRIQVQALDFDWIFDGNNSEVFLKLLELQGAEELFNQKSIQIFVELMWNEYKPQIIFWAFVPYIINLISLIMLTTVKSLSYIDCLKIVNEEPYDDGKGGIAGIDFPEWYIGKPGSEVLQPQNPNIDKLYVLTYALCILSYLFTLKNLIRELQQMYMIGPANYFTELWNWFDLTQFLLELFYISLVFKMVIDKEFHQTGITERYKMHLRTLGALTMLLKWLKFFYWGKLHQKPAYFIVQLYETVIEMRGFMAMLILVIVAFANFYMIIQKNKNFLVFDPEVPSDLVLEDGCEVEEEEAPAGYVSSNIGNEFMDAMLSMYLLSLGEFAELEGYSEGHDRQLAWLMFFIGTIIVQLVFMNMLIAVMSTPFGIVLEKEKLFKYKQQISLIVDFIDYVELKKYFSSMKYIMVVKPEEINVETGDNEKDYIIDQLNEKLKTMEKKNARRYDSIRDMMEKQAELTKDKSQSDQQQVQAVEAKK